MTDGNPNRRVGIEANPVLATRVVEEHPAPEAFLDRLDGQLPEATALLRLLLD